MLRTSAGGRVMNTSSPSGVLALHALWVVSAGSEARQAIERWIVPDALARGHRSKC
ncbi:MAG: hypothetical protein QOJ42_1149 [Acidobacteriaceae bacterium]|jgi:hypothetical protein|nr:hypothetical protein [Acidobacteriaceae bacterium]